MLLPIVSHTQNFHDKTQEYQYDNLNRLTKVVFSNGVSYSYSYDELGNRLSKTIGFSLPFDTFNPSSTGLTCINSHDGIIKIKAKGDLIYNVQVVATDSEYNETFVIDTGESDEIEISGLDGGEYTINISVEGVPQDIYTKSFIINLDEPEPLEATTGPGHNDNGKFTVSMTKGTAPYTIRLNGEIIGTTNASTFTFDANDGDILEVETAKACEGTFSEVLNILGAVTLYPNPAENEVTISMPNFDSSSELELFIYDLSGRMVKKILPRNSDTTINVLVSDLPSGMYMIKIPALDNQSFKILKK